MFFSTFINHRAYYFYAGKNGRKTYNFDDPAEFGDNAVEAHVDDEHHMGVPHDVPEGNAVTQDAPHEDNHGTGFGDTYSIMTMLQNMQLK